MKNKRSISHTAYSYLFIAGIILLAFNLRPAITSVGPIIGIIREDLGISNWSAGLLTSLPLIAFALMSPVAPRIANRTSNERGLMYGLLILLAGILIRSTSITALLFIGMLMIGSGIALINVLLPSLIKKNYPHRIGSMTGVYTTSMAVFAAIGSGLSVPLTTQAGLGWQLSLLSWGLLCVMGIVVWRFVMNRAPEQDNSELYEPTAVKLMSSALAWQVTIYMGLQSFLFYVTVSWLAEILVFNGFSSVSAGWYVAYMQFVSLPATFFTPVIAGKMTSQRPIVLVFGLSGIIGFSLLLTAPETVGTTIAITFIGIMTGSSISLALALLGLRTSSARQAAELSGMAQSFGYLLAAMGPLLVGLIFDIFGTWEPALIMVIVMTFVMMIFGMAASRDKKI